MGSIEHLLGKIHNCDCLEFMKQLPDKCVDLVLTDPPYEISTSKPGKSSLMCLDKYNGGQLERISLGFDIISVLEQFRRICKTTNIFCFCSNTQLGTIIKKAENICDYTTTLIWHKTNSAPFANGVWRQDIEFCVHMRDKGGYFEGNAKEKQKVSSIPCNPSQYGHPTEKPISLIQKYLCIGSPKESIVFDPFMGSGTTAVACERLGRKWFGCELEPKYCDIANRRILQERSQLKLPF